MDQDFCVYRDLLPQSWWPMDDDINCKIMADIKQMIYIDKTSLYSTSNCFLALKCVSQVRPTSEDLTVVAYS